MAVTAGKRSLLFRAVCLLLQLMITLVLYDEKHLNLFATLDARRAASLRSGLEWEGFRKEYFGIDFDYSWLVASSVVCNALELVTMTLGHPSLDSRFNLLAALLHLCGFVVTCYMLAQTWRMQAFGVVFALCSALPLFSSGLFVLDRLVIKSSVMRRVDIRI